MENPSETLWVFRNQMFTFLFICIHLLDAFTKLYIRRKNGSMKLIG